MIDLSTFVVDVAPPAVSSFPPTLREIEMLHILATLKRRGGDKAAVAKELGISVKTVYNKLNQHQAAREHWATVGGRR